MSGRKELYILLLRIWPRSGITAPPFIPVFTVALVKWVMENVPPYLLGVVVGLILSDCCFLYKSADPSFGIIFSASCSLAGAPRD